MEDTTHQLLRLLLKHGGMTVGDLAAELHLSQTAIRQHVERLLAAGLIAPGAAHHGRGRPSTIYVLTPKAYEEFPDAYQRVVATVLEIVSEPEGPAGLQKFLDAVAARWVREARPRLQGASIEERVARLLEFLTGLGFWVESERLRDDRGIMIKEYHCPLSQVTQRFPQVFEMVHHLIEHALEMQVVRLRCKRDGDPHTLYLVPTRSEKAKAA